jgi:hypothetical protein
MASRRLLEQQGWLCWLCDLPMSPEDASRDHIIPLSKGGANRENNIRLAHIRCNTIRGNIPAEISREYVQAKLRGVRKAAPKAKPESARILQMKPRAVPRPMLPNSDIPDWGSFLSHRRKV